MDGTRVIRSVQLLNILSYGPNTPEFELGPLNVIIGPNASGKSNLLESLSLIAAAPRDIQAPLREGGGIQEWTWKGAPEPPVATVRVTVGVPNGTMPLRYGLYFREFVARFMLLDEIVEDAASSTPGKEPYSFYQFNLGIPEFNVIDRESSVRRFIRDQDVRQDQSILSQRRDPFTYPELTYLATLFERMRFYREFQLGQNTPLRRPQQADLPQDYLSEDGSNLAVVLSHLLNQPQFKAWLLHQLEDFYPSVRDIQVVVLGGSVQVSFHEEGLQHPVPSSRLSDGTLRFLCLLVTLFSPEPPPVICIEEPEMGLHPDVIPHLAKLLVEASKRSQVIVTTHSDILVDALTDTPEAVVICEKVDGATQLRRLNANDLKVWLEKYRLGELWTSGHLGGNLY
ncbi:MAG: AAA family ATPase [Chloroflexota bacterium]|nr:AAA family ATPase [Chloroflexota bacterium]MDE2931493.1 AAA family ATPase [Chloroflexota bacterium]